MRSLLISTIAFGALVFAWDGAFATKVSISGTHSREEIKSTCLKAGGEYGEEKGGYGCINSCGSGKQSVCGVECTGNGKCSGTVPRAGRAPYTLGGILYATSGVKTAGGVNGRRLGHGRVVKTSGLQTKTIYRTGRGPTDSGGKGLTSYHSAGSAFPNGNDHHEGRRH